MLATKRVPAIGRAATSRAPAHRAAPLSRRTALSCRALAVGDSLPDFKLETDTNGQLSSKDMVTGHGAVLFIYPQACTRGCTLQANAFKDNIAAFTSRGYQVYGMSADPPAAQAGWKAEHGLPYLLLSDTTKSALSALGALGPNGKITRSHFVFAEGGKVEDAQIGIGSADSLPVALAFVTSKK